MLNKDIYLVSLEFGEDRLKANHSITFSDLRAHLETKGFQFNTAEEERLLGDLAQEVFFVYRGDDVDKRYFLNIEGYFKLLSYRELKEARESSVEARSYAIGAMVISIIIGIVQIVMS